MVALLSIYGTKTLYVGSTMLMIIGKKKQVSQGNSVAH